MQSLFYQNTSVIALQLAIPAAICLWLFFNGNIYNKTYLAVFIVLATSIVLLQNRTAVLALLAAFFYAVYPAINRGRHKKTFIIILTVFLAAISLLTFFLKTDSSQGRWFIWKLSFKLWKENWLSGIGWGKFNVAFNHAQAGYFASHSLYTKEAILASDGYFVFNEWFRFAIELGLAGLIGFLAISILLLNRAFKVAASKCGWAGAGIIVVFSGSLFSYPLSNFFILMTFVFFIMFIYMQDSLGRRMVYPLCFATMLLISFMAIKQLQQKATISRISELISSGYKTVAFNISVDVADNLKSHPGFTLLYLNLLYETNRLSEAIEWFNKFHEYHCSYRGHQIVAKSYEEKGETARAEHHYLTSLYIKPQLLQSRINLMDFYRRINAMDKASYWAKEVINYPAKVESKKVELLRIQARKFLESL